MYFWLHFKISTLAKEIVGRTVEQAKLKEALRSHRSELIAIYGRRRIGKTYLIREFYSNHFIFRFSGLRNGTRHEQLENFMIELKEKTTKFDQEEPENWLQAFHILKKYLKKIRQSKKKKVIFIDEFPWVDSMRSGFLQAFENFWNTYCTTRSDLIVVVCGSAASYMIKKIIRNKGGLHNRITRKIKLEPFTLKEVKAFLLFKDIKLPDIEILKIYMALGGIPEYLEHIQAGDSSVTAIDRICFQKGAQLEYEFDEVFKSLFDEGSYHEQIIQSIAKGPKKGMRRDEILSDKGLTSGGQFSKSMMELVESGFIEQYVSYRSKRKTTLFRIFDEFCLFHLQFIERNRSKSWTQLYTKNKYKSWCGYAFEMICYKHIENIKRAMQCDQIESTNYSWSNNEAQIDLIIDRNDNIINLCEIKFYNDIFTVDATYASNLRKKESQFIKDTKTKKGVTTNIVSTWGSKGTNSVGLVTNDVTMSSLFL